MMVTPKAESALLFALLLAVLIGDISATDTDNKSNESQLKVALLDYGPIGDHGWTYEGHMGVVRMARKLPYVSLSESENVSGSNDSQLLREYAQNGTRLIFCHSISFEQAIRDVAPEYPDVIFMWCGGREMIAPNVGTYYERIYQAEYLAGIVAGLMTKTNKIAAVEPISDPQVVMAINAFAKGIAEANPQATLNVEWVGSWYDPKKEKQLAMSLIKDGCDIITHGSDSDATGEAAEETGTYFISFGSNTARFFPHVFLTGIIWNWEPVMTDITKSVHNETWSSRPQKDWWYGMEDGAVELAPFSDLVPADCRRLTEERKRALANGQFCVFPGMSDEEMLKMNYLEPNVVGELPKS